MPYVLPILGVMFLRNTKGLWHWHNPVLWLLCYGTAALFASIFSPGFTGAFYFGMAYMMNLLIPLAFFTYKRRLPQRPEVVLLSATWLILISYDIVIYIFMRDQLAIGYGVTNVIQEVTRSSGLARFFGVAGLLCFARFWQGRTRLRWSLIIPLVFCAWVVWSMQSRGGMFGFVAGMVLIFFFSRASWRAYVVTVLALVTLFSSGQSDMLMGKVSDQVVRGQTQEQFMSMTGRTRSFKSGWEVFKEHPIIGQGNWADRYTIGEHVHNSYLQSLLNAGIIGFVPYMMSWIMGWWLFYKLYRWRNRMYPVDRQLLMEAGAVMAFFTIRSIPETTTASFSVDSMLMVPVYLYLFVVYQRLRGIVKSGVASKMPDRRGVKQYSSESEAKKYLQFGQR